MEELLTAIVRGLPFGCIYALLAIGLVLTYKTSGVFHIAYGAQAFVAAAVYYDTRVRHGWSIPWAVLLSVFIVSPLVGVLLERLLFRHQRNAPPMARLVTSIGLLVAIPELVKLWFGSAPAFGAVGIVSEGTTAYNPLGEVFVTRDDLMTMGATVLALVGLTVLFRTKTVGLRMRAVVESPRMTELAGVNAERVSVTSWALSSTLAGLAGVLLSPLFPQVASENFLILVTAAIAAAAFAGLTSIPLAFAGGILLGLAQQLLATYLPTNSVFATNLKPSLPFVALFLVLILMPIARVRRKTSDPLAGCDPPPPSLASAIRSASLTRLTRIAGIVAGLVLLYVAMFVADDYWLFLLTTAAVYAVIFMSITVITGMAGEISLCQPVFAAVGGLATGQLAINFGMSVLVAMVLGGLLAAAVSLLIALPALRLGGIYLSLATLAFALFFENVMVKFAWVSGGIAPAPVPRPLIGPIDFADDRAFFLLCVAILALMGLLVISVRGGTVGRYLDAMRGSEVAAASIGIDARRARITAFLLSAAVAGIGGGLLAMQTESIGTSLVQANFAAFAGLFWVVLVVTLGSRTVEGAIQAGIGFAIFPEVLKTWIPWIVNHVQPWYEMGPLPAGLTFVFFGLGAITYAKHPEGILEYQKRGSISRIQRRLDKRSGIGATDLAEPAPAAVGADTGGGG